jgi:hypothetical protein
MCEAETLMYNVLSEAYKHVLSGELFGAPECGVALPELVTTDFNRGSTVVKVLCYKSEGRWFAAFFVDIKSFQSHYGPGVDSASTEMSTRNISWG